VDLPSGDVIEYLVDGAGNLVGRFVYASGRYVPDYVVRRDESVVASAKEPTSLAQRHSRGIIYDHVWHPAELRYEFLCFKRIGALDGIESAIAGLIASLFATAGVTTGERNVVACRCGEFAATRALGA
jgi:hypothetical protein